MDAPDLGVVEHRHPDVAVDAGDHGGGLAGRDRLHDLAGDPVDPDDGVAEVVGDPDVAADHLEVHGGGPDVDGGDQLPGDSVDPGDGAVGRVRHPDVLAARGDPRRCPAAGAHLRQPVGLRVEPEHRTAV